MSRGRCADGSFLVFKAIPSLACTSESDMRFLAPRNYTFIGDPGCQLPGPHLLDKFDGFL